jgi:hypothetical protein
MQLRFLAPAQHPELAEVMAVAGTGKGFGLKDAGKGGAPTILIDSWALRQLAEGSEQLRSYRQGMEQLVRTFSGFKAAAEAMAVVHAGNEGQRAALPNGTHPAALEAAFTLPRQRHSGDQLHSPSGQGGCVSTLCRTLERARKAAVRPASLSLWLVCPTPWFGRASRVLELLACGTSCHNRLRQDGPGIDVLAERRAVNPWAASLQGLGGLRGQALQLSPSLVLQRAATRHWLP